MRAAERAEIDQANQELGFALARGLALQNAVLDRQLSPTCHRVLAAIGYFINSTTMRAWPSYALLAEIVGCSDDAGDRAIRKLRQCGYLFSYRAAPITGGRAIVHYGYQRIDPQFLDQLITRAVETVRNRKAHSDKNIGLTTPTELSVSDGLTQIKKSDSAILTPTSSPSSDSDFLTPQEPYESRTLESEALVTTHRRGTRLSDDWILPRSWGLWAMKNFIITEAQVRTEAAAFKDYWVGKSGKDAVKLSWSATWRNWLRNSRKNYTQRPSAETAIFEAALPVEKSEYDLEVEALQRITREQSDRLKRERLGVADG